MRDYRDALRAALRQMQGEDGSGLVATYAAPTTEFVDAENVALYNIGSGSYSHLVREGIVCRREASDDDRHHLMYKVASLPDPASVSAALLATVQTELAAVPHDPGGWWALLRSRITRHAETHSGTFTVDVRLDGAWTGPGIAGIVKPLLDGLISALHVHNREHAGALADRLGVLGDPDTVWAALCDPTAAVLGPPRTLVRPHGAKVAWNPADELCTSFRVQGGEVDRPRAVYAEVRATG